MLKRKVENIGSLSVFDNHKKLRYDFNRSPETAEKSKLLLDSESSSSSEDDGEGGGALLEGADLKINDEYAKRFEHNKKREELHRLEEKYQKTQKPKNGQYGDKHDEDEDSSSDEYEDDEGFLVTEDLEAQISATLQAIRNKDPRVYDEKITFYAPIDEEPGELQSTKGKEKPMHLRDYHRENLLRGASLAEENNELMVSRTFIEEQDDLKKVIVQEMHAAAEVDSNASGEKDDEGDGFLVRKDKSNASRPRIHSSRVANVEVDVTIADKDPETFLSNFMAARAWVPTDGARFQPLESDDEEEEDRAERFEAAYNLRFEDPQGSNEVLKSYARDIVATRSVRREEPKSRRKQRDVEREKREAEKIQRQEERARLRKLKIGEMEEKLQKVKRAAGLRGKTLNDEDWMVFLDDGWDDNKWEAEMEKRFGAEYYAEEDVGLEEDSGDEKATSSRIEKKKIKKPRWEDDIIIKDIIPEFEEEELDQNPGFALSDSEQGGSTHEEEQLSPKPKSSKVRKNEKLSKKKAARLERNRIEELIDKQLDVDHAMLPGKSKESSRFRYRETSPTSFGLTAHDILMAPDTSLNKYVGLKKMATFRDPEKKRKDKKKLGKKARLREWRRETFGSEEGPRIVTGSNAEGKARAGNGVDPAEDKKKKKKRSRNKNKDRISIEG